MGKVEKVLKKWGTKPTEVSRDEVVNILKRFGFEFDFKKGSHIVVRHTKLINQANFGALGEFTVPTKKGRTVKGFYLKEILVAISIVKEDE